MVDQRRELVRRISAMNEGQLSLVLLVVDTFYQEMEAERNEASDIVDDAFLEAFGDFLKLHHALSAAYLDKTRFEVALERILGALDRSARRPTSRTHRGHDITVGQERWSLKTQGDNKISRDYLFISKYMELGGGTWGASDTKDLAGLRDQFLNHLKGYDRVLQLRYFRHEASGAGVPTHLYELVEIPKSLLLEARMGELTWAERSKTIPRCGYCTVRDAAGGVKYRLYFDGGGERKLQIKNLRKDLCVIHGSWRFYDPNPPSADAS